ncbi:unnamed protein product, partial [Iphiclides podalirius]
MSFKYFAGPSISILLLTCASILTLNGALSKRLVRLKPKSDKTVPPTLIDKKAENLFSVLNKRPENDIFDPRSCKEDESLNMPNFTEPGRRISEIKCLENLWRMRFYDEMLFRSVKCGFDFDKLISIIFGGRDAEPREFPHMGALGWRSVNNTWIFKCGATLVSQNFMITAAHCSRATRSDTQIADPVPKIVRIGETNLEFKDLNEEHPKDAVIKRIIVHPYYRSPKKYYDIAILELDGPVMFTMKSHPACIWTNQYQEVFGKAALTGWGITEPGSQVAYPKLQVAEVDVLSLRDCDKRLHSRRNRHWRGLVYHQMCAGHLAGGIDSCQGDSGGPLQMEIDIPEYSDWKIHYIVGVTSFGYGCGVLNTPSVYTRVSSFVDWIESVVWEEEYKKMKKLH